MRFTFLETNCLEHPLMRASSVSVGGSPMPNAMRMHRAWKRTSGISDSCIAITTRRMMDSTSSWSYMRFGSGGGSSKLCVSVNPNAWFSGWISKI